jgi:hypothetical protein
MIMRKKVLSIFLLASIAGTSVMANDCKKANCDFKKDSDKQIKMHKKDYRGHGIIKFIHELDLNPSQMDKIKNIMQNSKPKFESYSKAFEGYSFNKDIYINISLNKYKNMVEFKANLIEKIYDVLDEKQKIEFKNLVEKSSSEPKKGMKNDKHCNGGR